MLEHFKELFRYDEAVNIALCDLFIQKPSINAKCRREFGHILAAQDIWLRRLQGREYFGIDVWPTPGAEECKASSTLRTEEWLEFLAGIESGDLERNYSYTDTEGVECETLCRHAIIHVINHGTHHRGKIAEWLREQGVAPPPLDFTSFSRRIC